MTHTVKHTYKKILILEGGWSNERDVSFATAAGIVKALASTHYTVNRLDVTRDLVALTQGIQKAKPDVIINALHGTGGEDGVIQGVLNILGIPYTHSGVLASSVAMNKVVSRHVFAQAGIPVPPSSVLTFESYKNNLSHPFPFPYVIKPISEGSSYGVSIISSNEDRLKAIDAWHFGDQILAEQYIPGREINVAVFGGKALGAIELKPHNGFYDYEAKYTEGKTTHIMPAPLTEADQKALYTYAELAHTVLNCKGISRSDFRLDDSKDAPVRIAMLEINTQPGMTPLSLVPEIAAYNNLSFVDVLEYMIENATCEK